MVERCYAKCYFCKVSFMRNVVMLSVVAPYKTMSHNIFSKVIIFYNKNLPGGAFFHGLTRLS